MSYPQSISATEISLFNEASLKLPTDAIPYWQRFVKSFTAKTSDELQGLQQELQRLLRENGVTYNIYGNESDPNRNWNLDPVPLLIAPKQWKIIEAGLQQRAVLLDCILKDVYGKSKLLKDQILPADLLYHHPGYLRSCIGLPQPTNRHALIMYAANLAFGADYRPWVISDRVQAPSGSGYALENRGAITRTLPEFFNGLKVQRLSPYFEQLTRTLHQYSPHQSAQPRAVILTPGPNNETYFEHSYLSNYLGLTLVQGSDLVVKDRYVWLKTLSGLEKVDVILRRVDDIWCDPLELKEDSQLGVPGLVHAIRSGNVRIANPLGCGILESPGLMPFLQTICRYFLNEDLLLPNIASWWCGQPQEMNYVLQQLDQLVIKKIYRGTLGSTAIDAASLSKTELKQLALQIQNKPWLYVGQEKIEVNTSPSYHQGKLIGRKALFRSFLVSKGEEGFCALAGGLTMMEASPEQFLISNQSGGISKDTWVLTDEPLTTTIANTYPIHLTPAAQRGILPSQTAENLFWVGRYTERLLGNARFMRTVVQFVADGTRLIDEQDIQVSEQKLLAAFTNYACAFPGFTNVADESLLQNPWPLLSKMLNDEQQFGALVFNFNQFKRSVYAVRDYWSTDTWRVLKGLESLWEEVKTQEVLNQGKMIRVLDQIVTAMVAFIGLNRESIAREQGWTLLDTGRKIEQCLLMIAMVQHLFPHQMDEQVAYYLQEAALRSNENLVNYRHKHRTLLQLPLVLDLLLLDPTNPRSLLFQVQRLEKLMASLPNTAPTGRIGNKQRLLLQVTTLLQLANPKQLATAHPKTGEYLYLTDLLKNCSELLLQFPVALSKTYFLHAQAQKQLFAYDNRL